MQIRFAENKDIAGILRLLQQIGKLHHEGRPDLFREKAQKYGPSQILALLQDSKTPVFVAAREDQVLGYCFCKVKDYTLDPVMEAHLSLHIDDLCVDEQHRGKGIGKALYMEACRYAKMRRCYNVTLNVWSFNEQAVKFYESLGLKPQKLGLESILED